MPDIPLIPLGASGTFDLVVTAEHLADRFKDQLLPPVLATPFLVLIVENAALNALKPFLPAGVTALGTRVDVQHLAATPAGRCVRAHAIVTAVDGRRIAFTVEACDGDEIIGRGTHERRLIDRERLNARLRDRFG